MLPKKRKKTNENAYDDPNVAHHRSILKEASLKHRTQSSFTTKEMLRVPKSLWTMYTPKKLPNAILVRGS